jgi:LacI family transcriptional regulator
LEWQIGHTDWVAVGQETIVPESNDKIHAERATMIDVAREAGVSFKTVSRVLNGEAYVREETRKVVLAAATKLNYQFNQAARALRAGAPQIVVLVVDNPSRSYLENVHLGTLKECHRLNLQLILDECPDGVEGIERILNTISPVGLIITPPLCDNPHVMALLKDRNVNHVMLAPKEPELSPLSVHMDDEAAAREATEYLLSLGHSRIGYIRGHPEHGAASKRESGYRAALDAAGIAYDPSLVRQGYFHYASGLSCAESLLDLGNRPTAIFASNDDMAAAVIAAAYARNISIPGELSVVGFDDSPIAGIISPHLTTIRQPVEQLGSEAAKLLASHLSPIGGDEAHVRLEHELIERNSAGPAK